MFGIEGGKRVELGETILISTSKPSNKIKIAALVCFGIALVSVIASIIVIIAEGYVEDYFTMGYFVIGIFGILAIIVGIILLTEGLTNMIVTDKRVCGKGVFSKHYSMPIEQISFVKCGILGSIVVKTSSGGARLIFISNNQEIVSVINTAIANKK